MAKTTNKKPLTAKQKAAKKRKRMILLILEIFVLLILLVVLYKVVTTIQGNAGGTGSRVEIGTDVGVNDEVAAAVKDNSDDASPMSNYRTIALVGVDSKNGSLGKGNNSDTMILANINLETKEVKLVSVFRDTYLNVGNDTYTKANAAYAKGGQKQCLTMLNSNLDLNIGDIVTVGYQALIDTVDALGGITIDVDSEEIKHINNYQQTIAEDLQLSYTEVTKTGTQVVDGMQAAAYCRIRYTAGNDFKRTERQREVIQAIVDKAQSAKISTLTEIANDIFPEVSTSLKLDEILNLLTSVKDYKIVETTGFPFESDRTTGTIKKGSMVIATTLAENVTLLHEFLFGETDYVPSATVQEYSQQVYDDTSPYVAQDAPDTVLTDDGQ